MSDYGAVYAHVNEVGRALGTGKVKCTKVMAKQAMLVRLDELTVEALEGADAVQQLVVFADIVEVASSSVSLPGFFISIVCRLLVLLNDQPQLTIHLPYWRITANSAAARADRPRCSIFAQQVVSPGALALSEGFVVQMSHQLLTLNGSPIYQHILWPFSSSLSSASSDPATRLLSNAGGVVELDPPPSSFTLTVAADGKNTTIVLNTVRWKACVEVEIGFPSLDVLIDPNIIMGIQATLLIAELILSYRTDLPDTVRAAQEHAQWVSDTLLQVVAARNSEEVVELKNLLARAQMLLKIPTDGSHNLIVPRLEYSGYHNLINRMAFVAESYNRELDGFMIFIRQTQIIAAELFERTKAFAQKERDVEELQALIVNRKRNELLQAEQAMASLNRELDRQVHDMNQAQHDMEMGLQQYKDREVARAFVGLLVAVVEVGVSFATGGLTALSAIRSSISAAKGLARLANLIKTVIEVVEKLAEAMQVLDAVRTLMDALSALDEMVEAPEMPEMPSIAEWDIFENEVELVAEDMPEEVSEALVWRTKCKNVAAVCREVTRMGVYISQLQYDLFVHAQQESIARKHAERLENIEAVNLDNYLEMATQIDMRTTRILMSLLKMMSIQNAALQYHYLLDREPFTGWPTIQSVRSRLVLKESQAVAALELLGPSTDFTRTFIVEGIPVDLLLSGEDWNFNISPHSNSPFPLTFSRVRIRYVEMKVVDPVVIPSTASGKLYILLQASRIFQDRRTGQVLEYEAAIPIQYPYAYNLSTGDTTLSNQPSLADANNVAFFRMTPFTDWRIRFSTSAYENEGLSFPIATTTQIEITFHIMAIRSIDTFHEEEA